MDIFSVDCPKCGMEFYGDHLLLTLHVHLHCPRCGLYFLKEESQGVRDGLKKVSSLVAKDGVIIEEMVYKPKD